MMRYTHLCVVGVLSVAGALGAHAGGQNPEQQATGGLALRADAVEFAVPGYKAGRNGAPGDGLRAARLHLRRPTFPRKQTAHRSS